MYGLAPWEDVDDSRITTILLTTENNILTWNPYTFLTMAYPSDAAFGLASLDPIFNAAHFHVQVVHIPTPKT